MQISTSPTSYAANALQNILASLESQLTSTTGQDLPTSSSSSAQAGNSNPSTPVYPPPTSAATQFSSETLAGLLNAQQSGASSTSGSNVIASGMISALDSNGDGELSLAEITNALDPTASSSASSASASATDQANSLSTSAIAAAFAKIDTNGDGEISSDELSTALKAYGHHHHHHHGGETNSASSASASASTTSTASADDTTSTTSTTSTAGATVSVAA